MKISSTPKRILAMIVIGIVLAVLLLTVGVPQKSIGVLTGGILFLFYIIENIRRRKHKRNIL